MIAMARLPRSPREPCGTSSLNMTRETSLIWRMCEAALRSIVPRMLLRTKEGTGGGLRHLWVVVAVLVVLVAGVDQRVDVPSYD
jgi:hypothetical protein